MKTQYMVKTLAGDYVAVVNSIQFARSKARQCEDATGKKCIILEIQIVKEITEY
ncbi:hypothetical protein HUU40_00320 [candidate division KSB1 bacterium]|nr:hypothetical protein [candidate division KSB1 bacterium]